MSPPYFGIQICKEDSCSRGQKMFFYNMHIYNFMWFQQKALIKINYYLTIRANIMYGKCSKILNPSCLPTRHR